MKVLITLVDTHLLKDFHIARTTIYQVKGNYWIVKLGPIVNCQYDYAIVSGPVTDNIGTRFSLYVLCRNVNKYEEKYEKEVKQWCVDNGFKYYWNEYVKTKQN